MSDDAEPATAAFVALSEMKAVDPTTWTDGRLFELSLRLDRVRALKAHLAEVESWLETDLAARMETDEVVVQGIGLLKRERMYRTKWRFEHSGQQIREDLAEAVAKDLALDVATGEYDDMKRNVARAAVRVAYEAIPSFSSLKVQGQRRLHLDVRDYRESEPYYKVSLEVGP